MGIIFIKGEKLRKNKPKEKSFTQGPIMLGITIGLGIFVCTAAVMIGLSYLGLIGNEAIGAEMFIPPEGIHYKIELQESIGMQESIP